MGTHNIIIVATGQAGTIHAGSTHEEAITVEVLDQPRVTSYNGTKSINNGGTGATVGPVVQMGVSRGAPYGAMLTITGLVGSYKITLNGHERTTDGSKYNHVNLTGTGGTDQISFGDLSFLSPGLGDVPIEVSKPGNEVYVQITGGYFGSAVHNLAKFTGDIYLIEDLEALNLDTIFLRGDYTLLDDLDFSSRAGYGAHAGPIIEGKFSGTFNGNGKTISGIRFATNSTSYLKFGIFEKIGGTSSDIAEVKNLKIEMGNTYQASLGVATVDGPNALGSLVAAIEGVAKISNVKADWSAIPDTVLTAFSSSSSGYMFKYNSSGPAMGLGGIVGILEPSSDLTIENIDVVGFLTSNTISGFRSYNDFMLGPTVTNMQVNVGGLVGHINNSTITATNIRVEADIAFENPYYHSTDYRNQVSGIAGFFGGMRNLSSKITLTDASFKGTLDRPSYIPLVDNELYPPSVILGMSDNITASTGGVIYNKVFFNNTSTGSQMISITESAGLNTTTTSNHFYFNKNVTGTPHTDMNNFPIGSGFPASRWTANGTSIEVEGSDY